MLSHAELLELKRWNTPTIYNGWEQITSHDVAADAFNIEETRDFMPHMGPMVGYAITVQFEPSHAEHRERTPTREANTATTSRLCRAQKLWLCKIWTSHGSSVRFGAK